MRAPQRPSLFTRGAALLASLACVSGCGLSTEGVYTRPQSFDRGGNDGGGASTDGATRDAPPVQDGSADAPVMDVPAMDAPPVQDGSADAPALDVTLDDARSEGGRDVASDAHSTDVASDAPTVPDAPTDEAVGVDAGPPLDVASDVPVDDGAFDVPDAPPDATGADVVSERRACLVPSFTDCGGAVCVDTMNDPSNCGSCGNDCGSIILGASCSAGVCTCGLGRTACGGRCVVDSSFLTDVSNCGSCGNVCPGATARCERGECSDVPVSSCSAGQTVCTVDGRCCGGTSGDTACCSAGCVNVKTDRTNCGGCGIACSDEQTCASGSCRCPATAPACGARTTCCPTGHCVAESCCAGPVYACGTGSAMCGAPPVVEGRMRCGDSTPPRYCSNCLQPLTCISCRTVAL